MAYGFIYVLIFSLAATLIQRMYFIIPPLFSLMIIATITTLYFNLVNIRKLKMLYAACWKEKVLWLKIMITILVMWSCSMTGPGLIGASLYNFLYFSWLGILGYFFLSLQDFKKNKVQLYFALGILGLLSLTILDQLHNNFIKNSVVGVVLALIGGTSSFIYFKQSKAVMAKACLSATQILGVRFYLTIITLFLITPQADFSLYFNGKNLLALIILAFLSLIIPLYFLQKALEKISSEKLAIIISLVPIVSAAFQEAFFQDVQWPYIVIYLTYSLIIASSYLIKKHM